ncbi:hypothetical protein BH10ACT3_BH10ACT3_05020 [soil metagenome]
MSGTIEDDTAALEGALSPVDAVRLATASWTDEEEFKDSTIARMSDVAERFARRVGARPSIEAVTIDDCDDFVHAATRSGEPPSLATLHFRRTTLRAVYRSLRYQGLSKVDPTLDMALPPKSTRTTRPLTDDEINLLRLCALGGSTISLRAATALALAEATATTREIPLVTVDDIDLAGSTVQLPGGARVEPRTTELTAWGIGVLTRRLELDTDNRLVPVRGDIHRLPAQAGTCNLIATLLHSARLRVEPDVRPGSIRAWAGVTAHRRSGRIEHAANQLGLRSLDATAELIAFEWQDRQ